MTDTYDDIDTPAPASPIPLKLDLASYEQDMSLIRDAVESNLKLATAQLTAAASPQEQTALTTHIILTRSLLNVLDNPPKVESWSDVQRIHKMARETLNMDGHKDAKGVDWNSLKTIKPAKAPAPIEAEIVEPPPKPKPIRIVPPRPPKPPKATAAAPEPNPEPLPFKAPKPSPTDKPDFRKPDGTYDRVAHMAWVRSQRNTNNTTDP